MAGRLRNVEIRSAEHALLTSIGILKKIIEYDEFEAIAREVWEDTDRAGRKFSCKTYEEWGVKV